MRFFAFAHRTLPSSMCPTLHALPTTTRTYFQNGKKKALQKLLLQGLAIVGEYGAAIVYISELAAAQHRCTLVAALQSTSQVGLVLALSLVMLLQAVFTTREFGSGAEGESGQRVGEK